MKDRYLQLLQAYADNDEDLEEIAEYADRFPAYVHAVYSMELNKEIVRMTKQDEEYREAFSQLDRTRHNAHELAIHGITMLNRLAEHAGVPVLFEGDLTKRQEIAEFCIAFVDEVFEKRVCART